jgi:hypothetical protein
VPNSITQETGLTPAHSRNLFITMDAKTSKKVLESTRKHKVREDSPLVTMLTWLLTCSVHQVTFGEGPKETMYLGYRLD